MGKNYDALEIRSADERSAAQIGSLKENLSVARKLPGYQGSLDEADVTDLGDLVRLPVLRKAALAEAQGAVRPFGGFAGPTEGFAHVFQSPGPIYEPGQRSRDWWRFGRFLFAAGIGSGDIVQNCFSYHMTPAGLMFENGAEAVGATVFPAGTGQTALQVRAAEDLGVTAYAGTPDFLKAILDQAENDGRSLSITKAAVSGGALFPSLRAEYSAQGITCLQCYGTADLGHIAYEALPDEGMIVDEGVILEIVRPGTGDVVEQGEVGEVVVTALTPEYPLIRFATGDLSAVMPGQSPCGRTNMRIRGWMGRADQTTKVRGMFVRPEQVADFVARFDDVERARIEVTRDGARDVMTLRLESNGAATEAFSETARDIFKLGADVQIEPVGSLPNDGKVIDDQRDYT